MTHHETPPERAAAPLTQDGRPPAHQGKAAGHAHEKPKGSWRPAEGPQEVGPDEARALLQLAPVRYVDARLDGQRVAQYATLMLMGTWHSSPEPIPLTDDDRLIDGLNRLAAIILSGTTQTMTIGRAGGSAGVLPEWYQGPRLCDVHPPSPADPARNTP